MSWIQAAELLPPDDEEVLVHNNAEGKIELGRRCNGKWFIGEQEVDNVTHWSWILESQLNDDSDDD